MCMFWQSKAGSSKLWDQLPWIHENQNSLYKRIESKTPVEHNAKKLNMIR